MRIQFEAQYVFDFAKTIEREGLKKGKALAKSEIRNLAQYLKKALHNAPQRAKRQNKLTGKPSAHYQEGPDLKVFFPDPKGGIRDSGMTVPEFLQMIKGAFRAKGFGSFQKEKVQTRVKGTSPPGTYAFKNQKPGQFFTKGTGRFSQKERERLAKIRERRRKLERNETRRNRKASAQDLKRVRELERKAEEALFESEKKTQRRQAVISGKRQKMMEARSQRNAERSRKLKAFDEKNRRYRIVIPNSRGGYTDKPRQKALFRIGGAAGKVPKTWSGGGLREYFISRNWQVEKISDLETNLVLRPQPKKEFQSPDQDANFQTLEQGGTMRSSPFLVGYVIDFRDETRRRNGTVQRFSHRRFSIRAIYSNDAELKSLRVPRRALTVNAHPFVGPTVEKVRKEFQSRKIS